MGIPLAYFYQTTILKKGGGLNKKDKEKNHPETQCCYINGALIFISLSLKSCAEQNLAPR